MGGRALTQFPHRGRRPGARERAGLGVGAAPFTMRVEGLVDAARLQKQDPRKFRDLPKRPRSRAAGAAGRRAGARRYIHNRVHDRKRLGGVCAL